MLKGNIFDSSFFGYIRAADVDDDWSDPEAWKKANPSYGITIRTDQFEDDFREAQQSPAKESAFRRYRLNQWVSHSDTWLSTAVWDTGKEPLDEQMLEGRDCYLGLDLARKHDIGALVLVFPIDEVYYLLPRFFLPSNCLIERERHDHVSYSAWVQRGLLTLTPGDVIDYAFIRQQVKDDAQRYRIQEIGYDPWNAELLCNQQLGNEDGFQVVEFRQSMAVMGPATALFEKLLREGRIRHGGHPVLAWMAGNCAVRQDQNENIMPTKRNSTGRIDGIIASIIGVSRAVASGNATFAEIIFL